MSSPSQPEVDPPRPRARPLRIALGLALLLAALIVVITRWSVTSDITSFLAQDVEDPRLAKIASRLAESELTRTVILSVEAPRADIATAGARALAEKLAPHPEVAWLRAGIEDGQGEAIHALYFPRRFQFLADSEQTRARALSDAGLGEAARELRRQLALPTSTLIKPIASEDPLLLFPAQLRRLEDARGGDLDLLDGQFISADGRHALIFLASKHSAFATAHYAPLQEAIDAAFAEVNAAHGQQLKLEQSGIGRFNLVAASSQQADAQRISIIGTVGLVILFLVMFRRPRYVLLALTPLVFGVVTAAAVVLLVYGRLHGLTLAFGATLIGVCIDYVVHLFNHHMLEPDPRGPIGTARRLSPGLWLGAITTIAGFGGLAWTSFPGLREMAVFAGVGVLAAVLATRYWLPALMPMRPRPGRVQAACAAALGRLLTRLHRRRGWLALLPTVAAALCVIGISRIEWVDDLSVLNKLDPELLAEDERVRERVARMDAGHFIISIGDDEEVALAVNDRVYARLERLQRDGELAAFQSLHTFLWSGALQRENLDAVALDLQLMVRLDRAFAANGFRPGAFAKLEGALAELRASPPAPLRFEDLLASPLGPLVRPFRVELPATAEHPAQVGVITFVRGVAPGVDLPAVLTDIPGAYFFDQRATMRAAYGRYRQRTVELVGAGLALVGLLVLARYRRLGLALAAFLPAVLAAVTTLAALALAGTAIHILHVVSLLLVLSMGVDYGVFLAESRVGAGVRELAATTLSVALACASTALAFGLLAMSKYPALHAIGVSVGLGVLLSLVLAPTGLLLVSRELPEDDARARDP
ncbi:MAG: MMPL family transporter, partial [Myxococcales bacterium]|nr:MMPL family transporter [Myxococcales bacterium]